MERNTVKRRGAGKNRNTSSRAGGKSVTSRNDVSKCSDVIGQRRKSTNDYSLSDCLGGGHSAGSEVLWEDTEACSTGASDEEEGGGQVQGGEKAGAENDRSVAAHKVELKLLYLSSETRSLIRDTLQQVRARPFAADAVQVSRVRGSARGGASSLQRQFWMRDRQLVVDDVVSVSPVVADAETQFREYAVCQLTRFGFHRLRSEAALDDAGGDLDLALNNLLMKAFLNTSSSNVSTQLADLKLSDASAEQECVEQRSEELAALRAILGESALHCSCAHCWTVSLDVPQLTQVLTKSSPAVPPPVSRRPQQDSGPANRSVCRNFSRGSCRRGGRCRFSHQTQPPKQTRDEQATDDDKPDQYCLQIRFPAGCMYPFSCPLVCLGRLEGSEYKCSTASSSLLDSALLHLSASLSAEAERLTADSQPVVYHLVCLLQDFSFLNTAVSSGVHPFSLPGALKSSTVRLCSTLCTTAPPAGPVFPSAAGGRPARPLVKDQQLLEEMMNTRRQLPVWQFRGAIVNATRDHRVVIVSGATGCGKSTQLPQFLLDAADPRHCSDVMIVCSQPRRLSAVSVAQRVAAERAEPVGNVIGYQIRMESRQCAVTRVLFCTLGVLLRKLHSAQYLHSLSHIIVDEVHERSEDSDFLLMLLRRSLSDHPRLRLVLMSATADAQLFSQYFNNAPIINIPGRTFPVERFYLESVIELTGYRPQHCDPAPPATTTPPSSPATAATPRPSLSDDRLSLTQLSARYPGLKESVLQCLSHIVRQQCEESSTDFDLLDHLLLWIANSSSEHLPEEGSLLVFLPGMAEIQQLMDRLLLHAVFAAGSSRFVLIALHSSVSNDSQQLVFRKMEPGVRKIILSTNLAETSITIDDCTIVIDAGKMKQTAFDCARQMESLDTVWVSRANADQRCGRAGRVRAGVSFHLYTSHRYMHGFSAHPVAEIMRKPLEQLVLRVKTLPFFQGVDVSVVLEQLLECPSAESVRGSVDRLRLLGALDARDSVTALGQHVSILPVDVRIGKLLVLGAILGCLDSVTTVAACLAYRSPFVSPFGRREEADACRMQFCQAGSDQLTCLLAFQKWRDALDQSKSAAYSFARENFLSASVLQMILALKRQYHELLSGVGLADHCQAARRPSHQQQADESRVLSALMCGALYPNVARVLTPPIKYVPCSLGALPTTPSARQIKFKTRRDGYVFIHPSSVVAKMKQFNCPYVVFHEKVRTSRVFLRGCTVVPAYPLLMFSGGDMKVQQFEDDQGKQRFVLSLDDGWIRVATADKELACMLVELRQELDGILRAKIECPSLSVSECPRSSRIIAAVLRLITEAR